MKEIICDVSELESPLPMVNTLGIVRGLERGEYVLMLHRMNPLPLFALLERDGYEYEKIEFEDGSVKVYIWRKDDNEVKSYIKEKFV